LRYLLDTHVLIWWVSDDPRLSKAVKAEIETSVHTTFVSAVSAYEIAFKFGMGKLPQSERLARAFEFEVAAEGFHGLPVSLAEAQLAGRMEHAHRDPFDRMLIAQALLNDMTLASNEKVFDSFGVKRLW